MLDRRSFCPTRTKEFQIPVHILYITRVSGPRPRCHVSTTLATDPRSCSGVSDHPSPKKGVRHLRRPFARRATLAAGSLLLARTPVLSRFHHLPGVQVSRKLLMRSAGEWKVLYPGLIGRCTISAKMPITANSRWTLRRRREYSVRGPLGKAKDRRDILRYSELRLQRPTALFSHL